MVESGSIFPGKTLYFQTATWNTQDGCEVFVDLLHGERRSPAVQYSMWGKSQALLTSGEVSARWQEDIELGVKSTEKKRQYEWRIDIGSMSGGADPPASWNGRGNGRDRG